MLVVTEREIQNGILRATDTGDHTLAYIRDIEGLNVSVLRFSKLFVDIAGRSVDTEAQNLLNKLRDDKIPAALAEGNIARYKEKIVVAFVSPVIISAKSLLT